MDLPAGTEIAGRYTIERILGHGGMGAVYVAHDHKFGEKVALKVAAAVGIAAEQIKDRFRRDMGGVVEAYEEAAHRLGVHLD